MNTLAACEPCDCTLYGTRSLYTTAKNPLQRWRNHANLAGAKYGMNPVTFLAIASIESNGDATLDGGGIVQITSDMLDQYNAWKNTNYTMDDLRGAGTLIDNESDAVTLSFDILGQYMKTINYITNSFALTATGWNGAYCGYRNGVNVFGPNSGYPIPTSPTCYGLAAVEAASYISEWWINPATGEASSFYWGDLPEVDASDYQTYFEVCKGNR